MVREYLGLIKGVASAALLIGLFIGGCSYGAGKKEAQIVQLQDRVQTLQEANKGFVAIEEERAREVRLAQRRAEEWKAAAEAAGERVGDAEEARRKAEENAREAMARARTDPSCAQLLRSRVCDAIPLP